MEILKVENLTKVYKQGTNEVRALDGGVTFGVNKGELVAIIGASGSGKDALNILYNDNSRNEINNTINIFVENTSLSEILSKNKIKAKNRL